MNSVFSSLSSLRSALFSRYFRCFRPLAVGAGLLCLSAVAAAGGGGFEQALDPLQKAIDLASSQLARLVGFVGPLFLAWQYLEGGVQGFSKSVVFCGALFAIILALNVIGMFGFAQGALL